MRSVKPKAERALFDYETNYIEDFEFPKRAQRFQMISGQKVWYDTILLIAICETIAAFHLPILGIPNECYTNIQSLFLISIVFQLVDLTLTFLTIYVTKIEYHNDAQRPWPILLLELLSCFPTSQCFGFTERTSQFLGIVKSLKVFRILYHFVGTWTNLGGHFKRQYLELFLAIVIFESAFAWLYFISSGATDGWQTYLKVFEMVSSQIVGKGGLISGHHQYKMSVFVYEIPISVSSLVVVLAISMPVTCQLIFVRALAGAHKKLYVHRVDIMKNFISKRNRMTPKNTEAIMNYFANYWEIRSGYLRQAKYENLLKTVFPFQALGELKMHNAYELFKHSSLLKDMETPLKRYLCFGVENRLAMKGEFVYRKYQIKDFMVYIKEGMVDVLSAENGESGIVTLTAGSCVGEVSLFLPQESRRNFRCVSTCVLLILPRKEFMSMVEFFPDAYAEIFEKVKGRLLTAKCLHKPVNSNFDQSAQMMCLKERLHRFMNSNHCHYVDNIYLASALSAQSAHKHYTKNNLETLAIKDRCKGEQDLVFRKKTFVWILQPESSIHEIWNFLVSICSLILAFIQPYICFYGAHIPILYILEMILLAIFYLDVAVSLITPPDKDSKAETVSEIFGERISRPGFILDLISIFPYTIFQVSLPLLNHPAVMMIRCLKLHRLNGLMNKWRDRFKLNITLHVCTYYGLLYILYIYWLGYLIAMDEIISSPFSPISIQIGSAVGFSLTSVPLKPSYIYTLANLFSVIFEVVTCVTIIVAYHLDYACNGKVYKYILGLERLAKINKGSQLFARLGSFIDTQLAHSKGFELVYKTNEFFSFPDYYQALTKKDVHLQVLFQLEMFKETPGELLKQLSTSSHMLVYHKHGLVLKTGLLCRKVIVLLAGEARTVEGTQFYITEKLKPLNLLEVAYETPSVRTIIGISNVIVVTFDYDYYLELLKDYRIRLEGLKNAIHLDTSNTKERLLKILMGTQVIVKSRKTERDYNFVHFESRNEKNSFGEYDYYSPFDEISPFGFIRVFLLSSTILPDSQFLFHWEYARCTFAYLSAFVFTIPPMGRKPYNLILIAFDLTSLIDIYMRLHVSYYNDFGILVTHPLFTSRYYLKHSFLIDFLGVFPFGLLMPKGYEIFCNYLHALQLYRLVGLKKHFLCVSYHVDYMFLLLMLFYGINVVSSFIYIYDCHNWGEETFECSHFNGANYLSIFYIITSITLTSGTSCNVPGESLLDDNVIMIIITGCALISIFIKIFISAFLFGSYYKVDNRLFATKGNVMRLINLMKHEKTSPYLNKQVKLYFEISYRWLQEETPYFLLKSNTSPVLRRDLTYRFFGKYFFTKTMFPDGSNRLVDFHKNIFREARPMVYPKNGYIITVNDVEDRIFFLLSGSVDVVYADGTVIRTLHDGSYFGNLYNDFNRQKVSFITNSVTKVFFMHCKKFQEILKFFPQIQMGFKRRRRDSVHYIDADNQLNHAEENKRMTKRELKYHYGIYYRFQCLSWVHFVVCCLIGLVWELYQLATGETHLAVLIFQYCSDLLHLIRSCWYFTVPFIDLNEEFITSKIRIKATTMGRKRWRYKMFIFQNIPFDLFFLMYLFYRHEKLEDFSLTFSLLRLNRLARIANVLEMFGTGTKRLCSFRTTPKCLTIIYFVIISTQLVAALLAVPDYAYSTFYSLNTSQIIRKAPEHLISNMRRLDSLEKVKLYIRYYYTSVNLHTYSNDNLYYPDSPIFLLIFMLIFTYVIVFQSLVMVHFYTLVLESYSLKKLLGRASNYVDTYFTLSSASKDTSVFTRNLLQSYLEHYWIMKKRKDDYALVHCPKYLQQAVKNSAFAYLLKGHPIFEHAHPDFIRQLCLFMKRVFYPTNCTVINKMDCRDCLFFLHKGNVSVLPFDTETTWNSVYALRAGDSWGFRETLLQRRYKYSYRTMGFCEIVELDWSECKHLLDFFPATRELIWETFNYYRFTHFIAPQIEKYAKKRRGRI